MTDAKKQPIIVPMANLITGSIFDKRALQISFERVVSAVNEIDADFAGLMESGKGYTLLADPITLTMAKQQQDQFAQPPAQPQYIRQAHGMYGGYGVPGFVSYFGIVPNGYDRVLLIPVHHLVAEIQMGQQQVMPVHVAALQFTAALDEILGDTPGVNRGFVAE